MITFSNLGKHGEFGNQLFQIAATIGCATKNNDSYIFPKWKSFASGHEYANLFETPITEVEDNFNNYDKYSEINFYYVEIPYVKGKNLDIYGYFQSDKYFEHCKDLIFKTFKPNNKLDKIKTLNFSNSVSLQLRFYDNSRSYSTSINLDATGNDMYYQPEENLYFLKNSINFFGKDKTYYVSTNNINKAKSMFGSYTNFNFLEDFNYLEQFFIQTLCENNIISNSSFGWWGAYLNNNPDKVVFAPEKWFKTDLNTKDLYPNDWRLI